MYVFFFQIVMFPKISRYWKLSDFTYNDRWVPSMKFFLLQTYIFNKLF